MTTEVPLYEQDFVVYTDTEHDRAAVAEVMELDIPHPTDRRDHGSYVRTDSIWGQKLLTRTQIKGVLCPKCQPGGKFKQEGEWGTFILLTLVTGEVTNARTGKGEMRWFRYCNQCNYFKEASL